ncbi:DUF5675 family protein [Leeuwenhoekiella sp. NPDC079379]|uniref:DUF5675 family protein n=1 Tax=Leeuwenhoekiella sp. NPDC079379 TaxID=3364122 RepID=UPI0037C5B895
MEWVLQRSYYATGTHGALYIEKRFVCFTIELPWRENQRQISCIPEGRYEVCPRISKKFGHHLILEDVPGRSYILLHPANNALMELQGCIAPVTELTGPGSGLHSRHALQRLMVIHRDAVEREEAVYLTITYTNHEFIRTLSKTHPAVFPHPAGGGH